MGMSAGALGQGGAGANRNVSPDAAAPAQGKDDGLVIEPEELPATYPHGPYEVRFHGPRHYVPVLRWRLQSGTLPPGIILEDNGELHGAAERAPVNFSCGVSKGWRATAAGRATGIQHQSGGGESRWRGKVPGACGGKPH